MSANLLEVTDLKQHFPIRRGIFSTTVGHVRAVDGISFNIREGETLGLVGESGCGKTTAGRTLLRLLNPTGGCIRFQGVDITRASSGSLRPLRRHMQIVFQDPYGSLNPRATVRAIVEEGLKIHGMGNKRQRLAKVQQTLARVGLDPRYINRYPHEFSGGQRQRISIARALVLEPKFMVLDEPISALDVSIQSQVINLLMDLKRELGLTYLFISHDLSVVEYLSDRVAVMYLGEIVETAPSGDLYRHPLHPYTHALLSSIPSIDPTQRRKRIILQGDVPSPINPPSGCRFHPRCPLAMDVCSLESPRELRFGEHSVGCHAVEQLVQEISPLGTTSSSGGQSVTQLSDGIKSQLAKKAPTTVVAS
ncbi:MAG: dipeptide ABC transporter ATP-binding protein [Planctomycetota bacterium]|nr:dipeptide ABC transporter ATP-binding protein [Planctomycetota bacterium]